MILPRQFWDTYHECIVTLRVRAGPGEAAESVLDAVRRLLFKPEPSPAQRASPAYDIDAEYLQLPPPIHDEALRAAAAKGIRVAGPPHREGPAAAALSLAVPEEKSAFEDRLAAPLRLALGAACGGRAVDITRVAAKPRGFRGGGSHPRPPAPTAPRPPHRPC